MAENFEKLSGGIEGVTEGPLAYLPQGRNFVQTSAFSTQDATEKLARVLGGDNNYDSSASPGGNRVIQQDTSAGGQAAVEQEPRHAVAPAVKDREVKGAPTTGVKSPSLLERVMAAESRKNEMSGDTDSKTPHNLQVREPAPVPKELVPGNLPDGRQKSAWTGSGPRAALHYDHQKVGELLKLAAVPNRGLVAEDSLYFCLAAQSSLAMVKEGASYLAREDVHPLKLMAELEDDLGSEWREWEPETIRQTLIKDAGVEPSDDVMSKIMAVKIVMRRPDVFFDNWRAMEKVSVALNHRSPMMEVIEDVPVEWLSNAAAIVEKIAGAADYGDETKNYVAARLYDQGYVVAPPHLRFADPRLGEMVGDDDFRRKVILAYAKSHDVRDLPDDESPVSVQLARLMRNNAYVLEQFGMAADQVGG